MDFIPPPFGQHSIYKKINYQGIQIVSKKYDDYKLFEFLEILKKNIIKDVL